MCFMQDGLAGARAAHHHQRLPGPDVELDSPEDLLAVERLPDPEEADLRGGAGGHGRQNITLVRKKSDRRMYRQAVTTAAVVARPTPSAPPLV